MLAHLTPIDIRLGNALRKILALQVTRGTKKRRSSFAVRGELLEDGQATYDDDLMMTLVRKVVSGKEDEADRVEEVIVQARDAETTAKELLVDDGWKLVEVKPKTVEVNGNGNAHHGAIGIGTTVELVLGTDLHSNGNGHHDEADEPKQTQFSWGEFLAEVPLKPKARNRKSKLVSASLFEWTLSFEQKREAEEPVGAGR